MQMEQSNLLLKYNKKGANNATIPFISLALPLTILTTVSTNAKKNKINANTVNQQKYAQYSLPKGANAF